MELCLNDSHDFVYDRVLARLSHTNELEYMGMPPSLSDTFLLISVLLHRCVRVCVHLCEIRRVLE